MSRPTIHIIGAGIAGLAAAVDLEPTGVRIVVHEAAKQAGGRCRSYFDQRLGMEIDNGNHLMVSANKNALAYIKAIGAQDRLTYFPDAHFEFVDLRSSERWTIAPWRGPLPLWRLGALRPRAAEYSDVMKLIFSRDDRPLRDIMRCEGPLYEKLIRPLLLAALNTEPAEASSELARNLLRETLLRGEAHCRPIMIREGLSGALVDPALRLLERHKVELRFGRRLQALCLERNRVAALQFEDQTIDLSPLDLVILATPASVTAALAPGMNAPAEFNTIVNAHYAVAPSAALAPITAVTGATTEWLFAYPNCLSVTVSAANRLLARDPQDLACEIWREVAQIAGLNGDLPPWRIIKEKRATFAATPEQNKRRPATRTALTNLLVAGDWTATGLPATIEGAVTSGFSAAREARLLLAADQCATPSSKEGKTFAHADHG